MKPMKQPGFFLLEFLIYFSLLALTSLLLGMAVTTTLQTSAKNFQKTDTIVQLTLIAHILARDLRQGPVAKSSWSVADHEIDWKMRERQRWELVGTKLMRTQGAEHAAIASGIETFTVQVDTAGDQVRGIFFELAKQGIVIKQYVALLERIYQCTS